ncbi:unnamed protein product [Adineta steineri]|uniref:Uncharacterized protein n=1 Tax=Adineta steineri TaxID=433720 RepID=A0A814BDJ5_9BILA|nr:unnamed protein product [Adineta steineri]CAF1263678.1 unnamed protein product [Adineta steineri]
MESYDLGISIRIATLLGVRIQRGIGVSVGAQFNTDIQHYKYRFWSSYSLRYLSTSECPSFVLHVHVRFSFHSPWYP